MGVMAFNAALKTAGGKPVQSREPPLLPREQSIGWAWTGPCRV